MDIAATVGTSASVSIGVSLAYLFGRHWIQTAIIRRQHRQTVRQYDAAARYLRENPLDGRSFVRAAKGR